MIHRLIDRNARWFVCQHRSHRLGLRCYREATYDHQCAKHSGACFDECPRETW